MSTIERARRAYTANNIPFTDDVARLPEPILLAAAEAWEKRAREGSEEVSILELKTTKAMVARLRRMSGIVTQGRTAADIISEQERQYHGKT